MSNFKRILEDLIIEKALKDDSFRNQLLEDSKSAFERETGITLPGSLTIRVLQEDPHNMYLVLPPLIGSAGDGELTEKELGSVAGGGIWGNAGPGI
jgi:hypothetical protein